jgi:hypothetical protein
MCLLGSPPLSTSLEHSSHARPFLLTTERSTNRSPTCPPRLRAPRLNIGTMRAHIGLVLLSILALAALTLALPAKPPRLGGSIDSCRRNGPKHPSKPGPRRPSPLRRDVLHEPHRREAAVAPRSYVLSPLGDLCHPLLCSSVVFFIYLSKFKTKRLIARVDLIVIGEGKWML